MAQFGPRSIERIRRTVRRVEATPAGSGIGARDPGPRGWQMGTLFATNTGTGFSAGTSRELDLKDRSGNVIIEDATVYAPSQGGSWPADADLIVSNVAGDWCVIGRFCP